MDLFTVAKIPVYCEGIAHRLEKRRGDEVKVVDLTLKLEPFTPQLASALDQDEYGFIKRALFKIGDASPVTDVRAIEFRAPSERQQLICFASPNTEVPSIALDQCKVTKIRARCQKDASGWVLYLHVSFGPLGKSELEYVNAFYTEQRFVSWSAAEPSLDFDDDGDGDEEGEDADVKASRPAMEFDDPRDDHDSEATADAKRTVGSRQRLHSHQTKKKTTGKPKGTRKKKSAPADA